MTSSHPAQTPERGPTTLREKAQGSWNWLIGYDQMEANRLGVPIVSSGDWLRDVFSHPGEKAYNYFDGLFPFRKWIGSYNLQWLTGDLIAGITVGLVLVPQSMSYATLARLPPEFGLYSSFVGVVIYAIFATSKDVTIGPVAVMSLQTANVIQAVIAKVGPHKYSNEVIASALAFICGAICLGIGLLRLGWLVELIPAPAVSGFMTGSAISIAAGQVPKLMGLKVTTNGVATYTVIINSLKQLPHTTLDAAFGLSALAFLYMSRSFFNWLPTRYPKLARPAFFASVLRNAFVIIVLTIASRVWLGSGHYPKKNYPISILKTVPSGFKHIGQPDISASLLSDMASQIPVSVIVLLLEHIAISKSFGRLNNYKIDPNQELIAIGVTNLVGPTFGGYAATGSFSRSAIKSKSGVRTPLAGWVTAIIVLIALYALTGTFYWIPNAALSAVIIHAVGDLIASPRQLYKFWLVSPFELLIWLGAVLATVFDSVEIGVYFSVAASAALLLVRIALPRGRWLGLVRISHGDATDSQGNPRGTVEHRDAFVPLDDKDGLRDPSIHVDAPAPGIFIFRFEEAFTYPNASHIADVITGKVRAETRPGKSNRYKTRGDRPWNDPGPVNPHLTKAWNRIRGRKTIEGEEDQQALEDTRPLLKALVFDFSSVSNVDTTSIQTLVDVRTSVERYTNGVVEFHFANILSPWIRRGLLAGGFGTGSALHQLTEIASAFPAGNAADPKVQEERNQAEADRRRAAGISDGPDEPRYVSDLETGLSANAESSSNNSPRPPAFDEISYAVPQLDKKTSYGSDGVDTGSAKSSAEINRDEKGDGNRFGRATPSAPSEISVPVIWGADLTPFFHLDLPAAYTAALGKDPKVNAIQRTQW